MAPQSSHRQTLAALGAALLVAAAGYGIVAAPASAAPAPPCSKAVHDAITVTGPDGKQYPTWHPAVDPVTGCSFGHEHGADPRTSAANTTMPPFGYVGALAGDNEPHEGFKVFVINRGTTSEGGVAQASSRVVFHMGTAGIGRYTTRLHSVVFDYVNPDGRALHLQGMADTGTAVGSTCDHPRKGGRDFSTTGCNDPYEIWAMTFKVMHPADPYTGLPEVRGAVSGSVATFNPITTRVPADDRRVLYTEVYRNGPMASDPMSPAARYRGCAREIYDGPTYWNNVNRKGASDVYWTDVYGRVNVAGEAPGLLRQEISRSSGNAKTFKYRQDFCDPTVHAPN